ncbi:MAG: hypothetical protein R3F42_02485 [Pseudomonadota bacterium]
MAAALDQLVVLLPGLAGPDCDRRITGHIRQRPAALDRLLTRGEPGAVTYRGWDAALGHQFGVPATATLPAAALSYLADSGRPPARYVLRADPVHLRADQSRLHLFEGHSFFITQDEADALVAGINALQTGQDWSLRAPHPQRWYLELATAPRMHTTAPAQAAGRNIDDFLPRGEDAARWQAVLTELQMLLHDHPVNRARELRGEPVINSLWLWGGGVLPLTLAAQVDAVYADDALALGLARHAGIPRGRVPSAVETLLPVAPAGQRALLVLDSLAWPAHYNDIEGWLTQLDQLETCWFAPLLAALGAGRIGTLVIEPCNGVRIQATRARLRGFWRRTRPFEERLKA